MPFFMGLVFLQPKVERWLYARPMQEKHQRIDILWCFITGAIAIPSSSQTKGCLSAGQSARPAGFVMQRQQSSYCQCSETLLKQA
jgi:hypothetical protein